MKLKRIYDLWDLTEEEQEKLLGMDVGIEEEIIIVELDAPSQSRFYGRKFAPIEISEYTAPSYPSIFRVLAYSIDDASLNIQCPVKKMSMAPYEARLELKEWLKRSNYFVNLKGLENYVLWNFCPKADVDYN